MPFEELDADSVGPLGELHFAAALRAGVQAIVVDHNISIDVENGTIIRQEVESVIVSFGNDDGAVVFERGLGRHLLVGDEWSLVLTQREIDVAAFDGKISFQILQTVGDSGLIDVPDFEKEAVLSGSGVDGHVGSGIGDFIFNLIEGGLVVCGRNQRQNCNGGNSAKGECNPWQVLARPFSSGRGRDRLKLHH